MREGILHHLLECWTLGKVVHSCALALIDVLGNYFPVVACAIVLTRTLLC
ncbi:MAG: hypothetical protein M0T85_00690 [Dehalococcoidales bacterium]|nr:hypothetical protein [Dehalococcoidales bacterium]